MGKWRDLVSDPATIGRAVVWALGTVGVICGAVNALPREMILSLGLSAKDIAWVGLTGIVANIVALRVGLRTEPR